MLFLSFGAKVHVQKLGLSLMAVFDKNKPIYTPIHDIQTRGIKMSIIL